MKLNKTLNRHCLSRAVNEDKDFKVIPYEATKKLIMESKLEDFADGFIHRIIFDVHSPIHDKLGLYFFLIHKVYKCRTEFLITGFILVGFI